MESTRRNFYVVLGLVLLAIVVRSWNLSSQSFSSDEVIELEDARLGFQSMVVAADGFPPLFRLMLASVLRATDSNIAGRWMSVFFGALCIPLVYGCGRVVGGHGVALLSALFVTLSPICIYYSQEARPYALYILAGTAMLYTGLVAIKEDKRGNWLRFGIAAVLACYVHYYSALMVTAIFLAWLIHSLSTKSFRGGLLAFLGIALACVPTLFFLYTDFAFTEDHSTIEVEFSVYALGYTFFCFLAGYTVGPSINELHELLQSPTEAVRAFVPAILITGLTLVLPMFLGIWQLRKNAPVLTVLVFAALIPVFFAASLTVVLDLNYNVRYVVASVIPCLILVAVGVASLRSQLLIVLATLAIAGWFTNGIVRRHKLTEYHNEDVLSAAQWLVDENLGRQNVYVISDYMARTLRFYTRDEVSVFPFPSADLVLARIESEDGLQRALSRVAAENEEGCWFAVTRAYHGDPARLFRNWLAEDQRVHWGASFTGVELFHWAPSGVFAGADGRDL